MRYEPKLIRLALTISAYASGVATLTYSVPKGVKLGAIGLSIGSLAALNDHQVTSMLHNEFEAVKVSTISGTDYGVPLAHVASYCGAESYLDGTRRKLGNQMQFWPGRLSFPGACQKVAVIPLKENATFTITVKRLYGATSIDAAYLWCVPLSNEEHSRRCNGQKNVVDRPQWLSQVMQLAATASTTKAQTERRWDAYDDRALRIVQPMVQVYVNTAGTLSYDVTYADAVYASLRDWDNVPLVNQLLENQVRVTEFFAQGMQAYDCLRDPRLVVPPKTGLRIFTTRDATAQQKDVYASFYGYLLDAEEMTGELVEAA